MGGSVISFGVILIGGFVLFAIVGIAVAVIIATQGSRRDDDDS